LAWVAGSVALLWAVLWLAVPPLLKWQLQTRLSALLGREFTVESVRFQPWNLDLVLHGVTVAAPSGAEPQLEVGRLRGNLSVSSLWRRAPVIEALEIDRLQLRMARLADGHYDVDDLLERFTPRADGPQADDAEPARFALYNVEVREAALRFDDRPVARVHQVEGLHLALPFLSSLPAQVEVTVRPRLAFKLNGVAFDSNAETTPFADDHETLLRLKVDGLDVAPYLGYVPKALPVQLARGVLASDLALRFREAGPAGSSVVLSGTLAARELALQDAAGAPLVAWRQLQLGLRDVQPLARKLAFDSLRLDGAELHVARDAAGRINLLNLQAAPRQPAATASAAPAASAPPRGTPSPWQVSLATLELSDARVTWRDAAVKPAAALVLDGLSLQARQLQWPAATPMPLSAQATLHAPGGNTPAAGRLAVQGNANDREARLDLTLSELSLEALAPYLAQALTPRLQGRLSAQGQIDWAAGDDATPARLKLGLAQAMLDELRVGPATAAMRSAVRDGATLQQLAAAGVLVDVPARSVTLGKVTLTQPVLGLARDTRQQLNVQRWLRGNAGHDGTAAAAPEAASPPPWRVQLDQLAIERGQLSFTDEAVLTHGEPTRLEISALQVGLQQLAWQGERPAPPARLQLSARIAAGGSPGQPAGGRAAAGGTLEWKGELGLAPLQARGQLRAVRVPVPALAAYAGDQLPVAVLRAEAGYSGQLAMRQTAAGLEAEASGDVLVGDLHVSTLASARRSPPADTDELLSWQALALKRLQFKLKPDTRPQLEIGEVALSDFYSRLVVTEEGRFNLQEVRPASAAASAPAAGTTPASAPQAADRSADAPLPLDIRVGGIQLTNGRVDFADRFVRPNYSAELTDLNGRLGAFGSASREMADVQLAGRVAGTGRLEIGGRINPTVKPLALDLQARAADIELSPLSPYAGKYAGYGIERGKLSVDVAYRIDADGRLEANNRMVLNQLTFGERIDSPTATKLPVLLAVALLKDRHGVIDVNLPVSGSLNDPEFSVGGIVVKLIVNLLVKALTAPFALLTGGGGEELNQVDFAPGTATLSAASERTLDKVAKALADRPALKMTVVGTADLAGEREAWQQARLDARLLAERRKEMLRSGVDPAAPVSMNTQERVRLLKTLYQQTDLPGKPRNVLGLAKDLPAAQMETLLRQQLPATPEAMRELAQQRGLVVRDALVAKGLPSERLFLGAPKPAAATGETAPGPRALLSLSVN
jgi:uncharacterized protein involved in outer membrane biogenesis